MKDEINIASYIDSTYLKTTYEANISEVENKRNVVKIINEAIDEDYACVMIRPKYVALAHKIAQDNNSKIVVGTVIDFPLGDSDTQNKLKEAKRAILDGAHDIDYVCDYNAFKRGNINKFDNDIIEGTKLVIKNKRVPKWIIETGALSKLEIRAISKQITNLVETNFPNNASDVFIKTSTGYYSGYGATIKDIKIIKSVSGSLRVKASGGVSSYEICLEMIHAGADRIGTSKAKSIIKKQNEFRNFIS